MSDVSTALLNVLQSRSRDLIVVCEIYASDALPGADGFDPADAAGCFTNVSGVTFAGRTYEREITQFSDITHTDPSTGGSFSNASLTFSNVDRVIATFHFTHELEGMWLVERIISRSTSVELEDSYVIFTGRIDKPGDADKRQLPITAKEMLGSIDVEIPPRKYSYDDDEGRRAADPLFEGFRFIPKQFTIQYQTSEPKGGLIGSLLGQKKHVTKTLQASSHSALEPEKPVPVTLGRAQHSLQHIGYGDFGNSITALSVGGDGLSHGILGFSNLRNVDPGFTPIQVTSLTPQYRFGYTAGEGSGDGINAPFGPAEQKPLVRAVGQPESVWPGNGPYSRTAFAGYFVNGSQLNVDDAAPQVLAIIYGNLMPVPDEDGNYEDIDFSDNPVDHARFVVTDPHLMNVNPAFMDDEVNTVEREYCNQILVDEAHTDTLVLPTTEEPDVDLTRGAGVDYQHWRPTGTITPDYFKKLAGEDVVPQRQEARYIFSDHPPIENGSGGGPGGDPSNPDPPTLYRARYKSNVAITETQKAYDFLTKVLYPAFRGYHKYSSKGKLRFGVKRPVDNSLLRDDVASGATEVPVYSILAWLYSLVGYVRIGTSDPLTDPQSEIREVVGVRYSSVGNSITLDTDGGVTASGAAFSGGNDTDTPATATLTVTDETGTKTVTIDDIEIVYAPYDDDTTATVAGLLAAAINSHPILTQYVKATWVAGESAVSLESKLGFLQLGEELEFDHDSGIASPVTAPTLTDTTGNLAAGDWMLVYSYETAEGETLVSDVATITLSSVGGIHVAAITPPAEVVAINYFLSRNADSDKLKFIHTGDGSAFNIESPPLQKARFTPARNTTPEECMRVMRSYSDRALRQANCTRANILMDTFKWPLGSRQKSINVIEVPYREAIDDFRPTRLRIKDEVHIAKVGKQLPEEVNGAAIDNYHQAFRIAIGALAEKRDADFFTQWGSDGEALLDEIGWVVCVTDYGSGLINFPVRIEEKSINAPGQITIGLIGRKYTSFLYADDVVERTIPLPTSLSLPRLRTEAAVEIDMSGGDVILTNAQANAGHIKFTGALTGDVTATIPDGVTGNTPDGSTSPGVSRTYVTENATTGAHTLHVVGASGGTPLDIPQGHSTGIKGGGGGFEPIET